jgi:methanogenic corrinoid protein MtbC1
MNAPDQAVARMMQASAAGYAALAAERMLRRDPSLAERFGQESFRHWKENLTGRVQELAVAFSRSRPELFTRQVAWARLAFESREAPLEDLKASLECLRDVLAEELPEHLRASVPRWFQQAMEELETPTATRPERILGKSAHAELAAEYLQAVLAGDQRRAARKVLDAVEAGRLGFEAAHVDVILPVQVEIGRLWVMGEIGVAHEHVATATAKMLIGQLALRHPPEGDHGKRVITASVAGNAHDVAIQIVASFLEHDGFQVIHMGADVPAEDLCVAVLDFRPELVALSVTMPVQLEEAEEAVSLLTSLGREEMLEGHAEPHRVKVLFGGSVFAPDSSPAGLPGADAYAASPSEAVACARRLCGLPDAPLANS